MMRKFSGLPSLPSREPDTHKGTYGRVCVVGGSFGMAGAVVLAGRGALRSGAGLVECVVPSRIGDIVSAKVTALTVRALASSPDGTFSDRAAPAVVEATAAAASAAVGMGIRTTPGPREVITALLAESKVPLVLDADGLNCVALEGADILDRASVPVVVTPHPGEMARLCNVSPAAVQARREETAGEFASTYGVIVVLKGHRTVVTDGERCYVNTTGNPGMAVGGSGDVLSGVIAGILASTGLPPFEAACAACWIHGAAGDEAAREKGEISMGPGDIVEALPAAFGRYPPC